MSESEPFSESSGDYYINGSPSPATLRNMLFLDMQPPPPHDDTILRGSLRLESDIPSRSTWSDESSDLVDPFLVTSTPELSFAASSSPYLSPAKECLFPRASCTRLPGASGIHLVDPASDHASFVRHLDVLLREVVEQRYVSKTSSNARIHPENVLDHKPQIVSSVCDASSDLGSVVVSKVRGSRSFPLLHRDWQRLSSPDSGDPGGCVLSVTSHDASYVPTRNKRKALATIQEDFNIAVHLPTHAERLPRRSDSYLSASDRASPLTRRCSDTSYPRLKKQKCRSIDGTRPPAIVLLSPLGKSSILSKTNVFQHKSSSFPRWKGHGSNIDRVSTKLMGATASISPLIRGQPEPQTTTPSYTWHNSPTGLVSAYPPTQPATRVPSPVPALSPHYFQEIEIPRLFASSEDAAEARLMSLLKKDVLHLRRKSSGALAALDFAPRDSFVLEVIAWILTVEPPEGSAITASGEQRVYSRDLHDQLTTHHDTRFLAALIFVSFFFSVSERPDDESLKVAHPPDVDQQEEYDDSRKLVVWDYAVAAITLAVKIHRDNLPPLRPIYARHFLAMAPHEMSFDDLEISQRDLLEFLTYDLGMPTPQAILDELHLALPSLRHVLRFERAWEDVLCETWKQLLAAARSPDILRFPVALLTATALIEAITRVVCRHLSLMKLRTRAAMTDTTKALFVEEKPTGEESRILHATSGLFGDISTVLGLSTDMIGECEEWFATVRWVSRQPVRSKYFK